MTAHQNSLDQSQGPSHRCPAVPSPWLDTGSQGSPRSSTGLLMVTASGAWSQNGKNSPGLLFWDRDTARKQPGNEAEGAARRSLQ